MKYRLPLDIITVQRGDSMRHPYRARRLLSVVALVASTLFGPLHAAPAMAQIPCTPTFTQPAGSPFSAGAAPNAVAAVDMNNDGKSDLAVVNGSSGSVSIFLGNGVGGFTQAPGSPISVGGSPSSIAVGNFDGNAFPDLAVGVPGPNLVAILLGNGDGSFNQSAGSIPVTDAPGGIAVGNFNADGLTDLAVTGQFASGLRILNGNGFGGFFLAAGSPIAVPEQPKAIVAGSFNGDGFTDLAITHGGAVNGVSVLLGTGPGTFSQAAGSPIAVGTSPAALVIGDFNADTLFDLAVANAGSSSVSVLLGNGNGTFNQAAGSPISGVSNPNGIVTGRFNADATEDLAVASTGSNAAVILSGNGSGGFTPLTGGPFNVGQQPFALASASFNGDGISDLAVVNQFSSNVSVLVSSCVSVVADLAVTVTDAPDPIPLTGDLSYTISVQNAGPDPASTVTLTAPIPAGTTFLIMVTPAGWACTSPGVGQTGTSTCTITTLPVGTTTFTLGVKVGPSAMVGFPLQNTVTVSATTQDPNSANNTATASTTVTPAPGSCVPRPRVALTVVRAGSNRLLATLNSTTDSTTPNNRLNQISATIPANARVDVVGGPNDLTGQQTLPVGNGTQIVTFFIRRVDGGPVHIPIEVLDQCGLWKTFAGGGNGAF